MAAETEKPSTNKTYKVLFEVSTDGAEEWQSALRNVENTRKELGEGMKIEVVTHGKGATCVDGVLSFTLGTKHTDSLAKSVCLPGVNGVKSECC